MRPCRIIHVVGARPNFMKAAPITSTSSVQACGRWRPKTWLDTRRSSSNCWYTRASTTATGRCCNNMSKVLFEDLELPQPDIYLGVGSGTHAQQTARIMLAFEPVLREWKGKGAEVNIG